ncbi:PREDICTED: glucose-1-phosphatase-like [Papilio polytes]|uniref:glucose-1-phosphatase-like n=1 Tax=Papilio polytes TaxID=76194 RepID=UPI000675CB8D|nr:PREDICTED: glucose-1-phosphatase-like [Papilio polytes]
MAGRRYDNVVLLLLVCLSNTIYGLKLEQVLILSRHNIRTPLTARLEDTTPYKWPQWKNEVGHLTDKGALLESYMAEYFAEWLNATGLLPRGCPEDADVFVYANTKQRTRESARAFVRGAFGNCSLSAYSIDSEDMDPVFNPVLRDTSETTKIKITGEMKQKLKELKLEAAYKELNEIIDLKNSDICRTNKFCDFSLGENEIVYEIGEEPNVVGPLATSNSVMDSFIMSYYEGMADEDVAWGKITKPEQWALLSTIIRENQNVRFNSTALARDVAKPLLQYIKSVFDRAPPRKVTVLFGHDSNLNSVMSALGFKYYELPHQYEATPPGGKIVFQKWRDESTNRYLLKINYVYQSTDQIREASRLSLGKPPLWARLELRDCAADGDGFCPWNEFQNVLGAI